MNPNSPTPARARPHLDVAAVAAITVLTYVVCVQFEVHEHLARWLQRLERWQVDELPVVLLVLAVGMAWVALRRWREADRALQLQARAQADAAALLTRNRELSRGLLALQESERLALARELHDEVGQCCTALRMELAWLRHADAADECGRRAAAERADHAAQSVYQLVRGLLGRLRPQHLDTLGLVPALQALCEGWSARSGLACSFRCEGVSEDPDPAAAIAVYRVAQEALTNVMRHAHARRVAVRLWRAADGTLRLSVEDDGIGMAANEPRHGFGLMGATERAASLGGALTLDSGPGRGVALRLVLPPAPARSLPEAA